jgi:hypothetical protein
MSGDFYLEGLDCPNCAGRFLVAEQVDAEGLPVGEIECISCGATFQQAVDVQPVPMPCEHENCHSLDTQMYTYLSLDENGKDVSECLCIEHAIEAGFCYLCGHFSAGLESYDFSPVNGVCGDCVELLRDEAGEYDDDDGFDFDYDDFGYDCSSSYEDGEEVDS